MKPVLTCTDINLGRLSVLLKRFGLKLELVPEDALQWLLQRQLLDEAGNPTWRLRG